MNVKHFGIALSIIALLIASTGPSVMAQGNGNGNGNGGGNNGGSGERFGVVEIPIDHGMANAISEPNQGIVTVGIRGSDEGHSSGAFARIDSDNKTVLQYGFLPEPPFVDPESGEFQNGYSSVSDVNNDGILVGEASTFEDDTSYTGTDINPSRGIVWTYTGSQYEFELLPTFNLAASHANGINNFGEIVGSSDNRAVLWDPLTHDIEDLNTPLTAALGWDLWSANDINDMGLVVGHGMLEEKIRGFLLDLDSGAIWAIPLIGPADANGGRRINAFGRVVGDAWNGNGRHDGTNPDYVMGFSWEGPGHPPVILESVTNNTSLAFGLNDLGDSVGVSIIPNDDIRANNRVPTLWEPDGNGSMTALDLREEIGGYTSWLLTNCININNEGWITAQGRKRFRGRYVWRALIIVPN